MNRLVVGDRSKLNHCSIRRLVDCFNNSSGTLLLLQEWKLLSRGLETSRTKEKLLEEDLERRRKGLLDVLEELLEEWRMTNSEKAKLTDLLQVLENKCRWKDIADAIWNTYHNQFENDTSWDDLDVKTKQVCLNHKVEFLGHIEALGECLQRVPDSDRENILGLIPPCLLQELLTKQVTVLAKNEIPSVPPYYIPRYLSRRTRLNPEIFSDTCPDVFVIENVTLRKLYQLAKLKRVDRSSSQVRKLTVRFIWLEFPEDFERIANIADRTPVHLIRKHEESFFWVKSRGNLHIIQEYIHTDQDIVEETAFVGRVPKTGTVCFADDPGMGKSLLLANLFQLNLEVNPQRVIIYSEFRKLLEICKNLDPHHIKQKVLNVIAESVCASDLGKRILLSLLRADKAVPMVFLDGFDEVDTQNLVRATEIIESLVKWHPLIQVFCCTRQHRQEYLENILGEMSYKIIPFNYSNQMDFFCNFWYHQFQIPATGSLKEFAMNLIKNVKQKLKSKGVEVIGIPLQCAILAEIYSDDAKKYSHGISKLGIYVEPMSICDMYKFLEKKRFTRLADRQKHHLKLLHALAAITSIFPDLPIPEEIKSYYLKQFDIVEINRLGYMNITKSHHPVISNADIRFVHRTFSEYFLASLMVDVLFGFVKLPEGLTKQLVNSCLQQSKANKHIRLNTIDCEIPELLETMDKCKHIEKIKLDTSWKKLAERLGLDEKTISELYSVMVHREDADLAALPNKWILCHPVYHVLLKWTNNFTSTPQLVRFLQALKAIGFADVADQLEFHFKDTRCPYTFDQANLVFFVDGFLDQMKLDLHHFVIKSAIIKTLPIIPETEAILAALFHSFENIFQLISGLFIRLDASTLLSHNKCSLLLKSAIRYSNVRLIDKASMFLKQCGYASRLNDDTSLKLAAHRGDILVYECVLSHQSHKITDPASVLQSCVMLTFNEEESVICQKLEIVNGIVSDYKSQFLAGDFKNDHKSDCCLLIHFRITEFLLNLGVHLNVFSDDNYSIAHFAAENYTPSEFNQICKLLIEKGFSDILNTTNVVGDTPFEIALRLNRVSQESLMFFLDSQVLTAKHVVCAIAGFQDTQTLKLIFEDCTQEVLKTSNIQHFAATTGNNESIQLLTSMGCNVNVRNQFGMTPLHEVIRNGGKNIHLVVDALLNAKIVVDALDRGGYTALYHAQRESDLWRIEDRTLALLQDANLTSSSDSFGGEFSDWQNCETRSLLVYCAKAGVPADMDRKILKNIDARDESGRTVVHWACFNENVEALKYFVRLKADVNAIENEGNSPIFYACEAKNTFCDLMNTLIENGGDINAVNGKGNNMVLAATSAGRSVRDLQHAIQLGGNWKAKTLDGMNVIHLAIQGKHFEALTYFLELGCDLQQKTLDGRQPIHFITFATTGFQEMLKALINFGYDINATDNEGMNLVLYCTLEGKSPAEIDRVIELGGNWRAKTTDGRNVLHLAVEAGHFQILRHFLQMGSDKEEKTLAGKTPLHYLAYARSNLLTTLRILLNNGADINAIDEEGYNLVLACALKGQGTVAEIKHLISHGANWQAKTLNGSNVLHLAAQSANCELIKLFLELSSDLQEKTDDGQLPIHFLAYAKKNIAHALRVLVEGGADINEVDGEGYNLLMISVLERREVEELKTIVELGGNCKMKSLDGRGVLHLATQRGHVEAAQYFLTKGLDLGERTADHHVPLHYLAYASNMFEETLRLLVNGGANINELNASGYSLLLICTTKEDRSLQDLQLITDLGGDWTAKSVDGNTVLHLAANAGKFEVAKYFIQLGCDVHCINSDGQQPLHLVANAPSGFQETLRVLRETGGDVNSINGDGFNLLMLCVLQHQRSVDDIKSVVKAGGNLGFRAPNSFNAIHMAALLGRVEVLQYFIELGCDLHEQTVGGQTALHFLGYAEANFTDMLELLLGNGVDINATDYEGYTLLLICLLKAGKTLHEIKRVVELGGDWKANSFDGKGVLHLTAQQGNFEVASYFLGLGCNLNAKTLDGYLPLHFLSQTSSGFQQTLELLLQNGACINALDDDGNNLLILCIQEGRNIEELKYVVHLGGDWQTKAFGGKTVLHFAVEQENIEVLKHFIELGSNIHETTLNGKEPLHFVAHAEENFSEILQVLLVKGADINAVDGDGYNLMLRCVLEGRPETDLLELVERGGNWQTTNPVGDNVLALAAVCSNFDALKLFVSLGADVNSRNQNNSVPLQNLAFGDSENFYECLSLLVENGAEINATDNDGDNMILKATFYGMSVEELELIIIHGGDWKSRNKQKQTVLHLAVEGGNLKALEYFINKGIDIECRDVSGRTPMLSFENAKCNKEEVLKILFKYHADINAADKNGKTLFQILIDKEETDSLSVLNKVLSEVL